MVGRACPGSCAIPMSPNPITGSAIARRSRCRQRDRARDASVSMEAIARSDDRQRINAAALAAGGRCCVTPGPATKVRCCFSINAAASRGVENSSAGRAGHAPATRSDTAASYGAGRQRSHQNAPAPTPLKASPDAAQTPGPETAPIAPITTPTRPIPASPPRPAGHRGPWPSMTPRSTSPTRKNGAPIERMATAPKPSMNPTTSH
jgi:hypothetical protein